MNKADYEKLVAARRLATKKAGLYLIENYGQAYCTNERADEILAELLRSNVTMDSIESMVSELGKMPDPVIPETATHLLEGGEWLRIGEKLSVY